MASDIVSYSNKYFTQKNNNNIYKEQTILSSRAQSIERQYFLLGLSSSFSVVFNSLWPFGLYPARLLCPWDSPGKNIGVDRHSLLQGIFHNPGI